MANFVFNTVKGEVKTLFGLPAANDAIILMLLEATGLETQANLEDSVSFTEVLDGTTNEQTNQARKTITASITVTVNMTDNRLDIDIPDQVYTALGGNPVGAGVVGYDGDTTAGTDANIRPVSHHDAAITPDGTDVTLVVNDIVRAT